MPEDHNGVLVYTRAELVALIDGIYVQHPRLRDYQSDCGSPWSCGNFDLTPDEAEAYEALRGWLYLAGA